MKPCPECNSENVYRYKKFIDSAGGYGPELLPKLKPGYFSFAKILPVLCGDCGYVRYYASDKAREKLKDSKDWVRV